MGQKLGIFDRVTIGTIVGAALIQAAQQALKDADQVRTAMPMLDLSGGWNYVPLALLVVGAASWAAKHLIKPADVAPSKPAAPGPSLSFPVETGGRAFLPEEFTRARIEDLTKGMTSRQAEAMHSTYVGKWMRFSGRVHDIKTVDSESIMVFFAPASGDLGLDDKAFSPVFKRKFWEDRLSTVHKGDVIRGVGRLDLVFGGSLGLRDCELV